MSDNRDVWVFIEQEDGQVAHVSLELLGKARELAEELGDSVTFYKIGLELMMSGEYFDLLDWMLARDKKVFCDLKFFDIPATVGSAVRSLKDRGATFVTVHGNRSIMEAAAANKGDSLKVLGVTVLGLASVNVSNALASVLNEGQSTSPYWIQTGLIAVYFIVLLVLYLRDMK